MPVAPVEAEMGLTRFCPCTQGSFHAPTAVGRAVHRHFGAAGRCVELLRLSYDSLPEVGEVTVYDATVFHAGLENLGHVERPFLDLSFAASAASVEARGYLEESLELAGASPARRSSLAAEVQKFRRRSGQGSGVRHASASPEL
mmetsp:Transcript_52503/g.163015  ORF Transcript_52503/g.163015 Transcript_52503/m.163015 type:complete len:144 (+) Transcript_52503:1019-1450(+)